MTAGDSLHEDICHDIVTSLYQSILDREPDEIGFKQHTTDLVTNGLVYLPDLINKFIRSPEFSAVKSGKTIDISSLEGNPYFDFSEVARVELDQLFAKTATYWREQGSTPEEIYWSVLSSDEWRGELDSETRIRFLESGRLHADLILKYAKLGGFTPTSSSSALDFGCGVGRLAYNLAPHFADISCVDFSKSHLQECKSNLSKLTDSKFFYYALDDIHDLSLLPNQDVIYSLIVLQHNTPPIMLEMIKSLLELLNPGGVAVLHIPIAKPNYSFSVSQYLSSTESGHYIEMHILPKANLHQVAASHGCSVTYAEAVPWTGVSYSEVVVFTKNNS